MPRQGALVCGLVLMLAAAVPALSTAATKQHALEPSTHDAVGGVDLDEVPRDLERAGECEKPIASCGEGYGTAFRDCRRHFELNENGDAIMCRNHHGGEPGEPKQGTWMCIVQQSQRRELQTEEGLLIFKKKTARKCPKVFGLNGETYERHYTDKYCEPYSQGGAPRAGPSWAPAKWRCEDDQHYKKQHDERLHHPTRARL